MPTFWGSDTTCVTDLPRIDVQVSDPRVLIGQRTARRLTTPRGALGLINDDPSVGFDVRQFINAKLSPGQISAAQTQIKNEVLKDEQVLSADVRITLAQSMLTINVQMTTAEGPFLLTLNVEDLTVAAIFNFS